jgi:hypothetical protein
VEGGGGKGGGSDLQALGRLQLQRPLIAHVTVTLTRLSLVAVAWVGERRAGRRPRRRVLPLQGQPCCRDSTPLQVQPLCGAGRLKLALLYLVLPDHAAACGGPCGRSGIAAVVALPAYCDRIHLKLVPARARCVEHLHLDAARVPTQLRLRRWSEEQHKWQDSPPRRNANEHEYRTKQPCSFACRNSCGSEDRDALLRALLVAVAIQLGRLARAPGLGPRVG